MNNISANRSYYDYDLQIEYRKTNDKDLPLQPAEADNNYFKIVYVMSGAYEIYYKQNVLTLHKGGIVIAGKNSSFKLNRIARSSELITVYFLSSIAGKAADNDFFSLFYDAEPDHVIYPATFSNMTCYELLNSLLASLTERRNRFYMLIKINAIIAELNSEYDRKHKRETFDKTNKALAILEYVNNNYAENITLSLLREKFFVSNSTINRIFKNITNKTFLHFINDLRLVNAKKMIEQNNMNLSLAKIAEINGFSTYSTFYREYLRKYGRTPKDDYGKVIDYTWPLRVN
ncbi:MAG: helix-turn-helix transcriptional regulator [Acutalibacteraceae bacterium]